MKTNSPEQINQFEFLSPDLSAFARGKSLFLGVSEALRASGRACMKHRVLGSGYWALYGRPSFFVAGWL